MVGMVFVAIAFLAGVFGMRVLDDVNVSYYWRCFKNARETLKTKKRARKHRNDERQEPKL